MKKKFIQFLIDNGTLYPFCSALALFKKRSLTQQLSIYKDKPHDYIMRAFTWNKSKEGSEYWAILSRDWKQLLL